MSAGRRADWRVRDLLAAVIANLLFRQPYLEYSLGTGPISAEVPFAENQERDFDVTYFPATKFIYNVKRLPDSDDYKRFQLTPRDNPA